VVDPLSAATSELFGQVNSFLSHNAPLRIGLVFSVSADKKVTGLQDAGVAVVCAFNYVVQSYDGEEANMKGFNFLQDVSAVCNSSDVG
jgi:UDP-glucose:glycoprotein glucosyltransferase